MPLPKGFDARADALIAPFVYPAAWLLRRVRAHGVERMPRCREALLRMGVFPVIDNYYEPQFDFRSLRRRPDEERDLPGIDWNVEGQLALLDSFTHAAELAEFPVERPERPGFYYGNEMFGRGDAEYWYLLLREKKPRRVFEIGSGYSTLLAAAAIARNLADDPGSTCKHVCVEPFSNPWLEPAGVTVVRRPAEEVGAAFFSELEDGDVLFIDSSHIVHPDGDVLFEYLELLPTLAKGVIVHVHDVFSPRNYHEEWLVQMVRFWNEQYVLEAFLTHNESWRIVGALNYLFRDHFDRFARAVPGLSPDACPVSFYLQKTA